MQDPHHILSLLTFTPLIGALVIALLPKRFEAEARRVALLAGVIALALALLTVAKFDRGTDGMQLVEKFAWIPAIDVDYHVGVDGLSILMVLLTAVLIPFALLASAPIAKHVRAYYALMLTTQAGLFGVFTALNFFHWFIFWEAGLIPVFFLIKLWGSDGAEKAALKFFLYTLVGSVTLLLAFQVIYLATGTWDFITLRELAAKAEIGTRVAALLGQLGLHVTPERAGALLFFGAFLGFAIKVPVWPLHTWLPDAYTKAPAAVTMVLTGVLSKMGVYGLLRIILPIFPGEVAAYATPLAWLAMLTIVFGALAAIAQLDLKRMIAYSSVNHLGYCLLGIAAVAHATGAGNASATVNWVNEKACALNGAIFQMFNHGITAAALFMMIGFIEDRTGRRGIEDFGGLRAVAPVFAGLFGISAMASIGLPGLNGFIGEFMIFKGAWPVITPFAAVSLIGLVATAVYLLTFIQRVFAGPLNERWAKFPDLSRRELLATAPLVALMFVAGLCPAPFINLTNTAAVKLVVLFQPAAQAVAGQSDAVKATADSCRPEGPAVNQPRASESASAALGKRANKDGRPE
ncbi:MAG: NADH-quinone oxidoreductase subunit M, partial [Verrucomicrobia bacterium]|nr:NADH-quinone oxidoreductase subunit M [Verrucomicrobiota bacterium]